MFLGSRRYRSIALLPLLIQCAIQMAFPSSLGGAVEPCDPECDESHVCVNSTCVKCMTSDMNGGMCGSPNPTDVCCKGLTCRDLFDCCDPTEGEGCCVQIDSDCSDFPEDCCTGYSCVNDLCCANQGTVCSDESDTSCCSGLVCQQSTDGDGTYLCVHHCPKTGESCSGELDCCNGYACMFSSGQDYHLECCGVSGGICATNDSCCQGHLCIDSTCCSESLFSCRTDEDCCGSGVCLEDMCCVGESGDCNTETDNCCSGHVCRMSVDGSENGNGLCVSGAFSQFNRKHGLALPLMTSFGFLGYFLFVLL